jgi:hypothetical protein
LELMALTARNGPSYIAALRSSAILREGVHEPGRTAQVLLITTERQNPEPVAVEVVASLAKLRNGYSLRFKEVRGTCHPDSLSL